MQLKLILQIVFFTLYLSDSYSQIFDKYTFDTLGTTKIIQKVSFDTENKYVSYVDRVFHHEYEVSSVDFQFINKMNEPGLDDEYYRKASKLLEKYKPYTIELIPDIYESKHLDPRTFFEVVVNKESYIFFGDQPRYIIKLESLKTGFQLRDRAISATENFRGLNISYKFYSGDQLIDEFTGKRNLALYQIQRAAKNKAVNVIVVDLTNDFNDKISMKFYLE